MAFALAWQDCRIKVFQFIRGSLRPLMVLDSGVLAPRLLGLMALTGRRQTEIFFSAKFSLPKKEAPLSRSSQRVMDRAIARWTLKTEARNRFQPAASLVYVHLSDLQSTRRRAECNGSRSPESDP